MHRHVRVSTCLRRLPHSRLLRRHGRACLSHPSRDPCPVTCLILKFSVLPVSCSRHILVAAPVASLVCFACTEAWWGRLGRAKWRERENHDDGRGQEEETGWRNPGQVKRKRPFRAERRIVADTFTSATLPQWRERGRGGCSGRQEEREEGLGEDGYAHLLFHSYFPSTSPCRSSST
jgi:hypothetical protein